MLDGQKVTDEAKAMAMRCAGLIEIRTIPDVSQHLLFKAVGAHLIATKSTPNDGALPRPHGFNRGNVVKGECARALIWIDLSYQELHRQRSITHFDAASGSCRMNPLVPRLACSRLSFLYPSLLLSPIPASQRHESSARRTTKRLRVKTDPTFTSSIPTDQLQDHVVFNPPSSAPSSYHTPVAFLPPNDPRRTLLSQSHERANPYSNPDKRLPPPVRQPYEKKYHLKEEDLAEIRRLRREDPSKWTRIQLAKKFECSQFYIALVCEASQERKTQHREALEAVKSKWGKKRRYAREDRQKRKELWGRDA